MHLVLSLKLKQRIAEGTEETGSDGEGDGTADNDDSGNS